MRCLRSALEASAPPFIEVQPDGSVQLHLSDRLTWLAPPNEALPLTGERLRISDQCTRISVAAAPTPPPPEGPRRPAREGDGPMSTDIPSPLSPPLCEEKVYALLKLDGVYYTWIITGKTVFPTTAGVSILDWMTFLHMTIYDTPNASVGIVNGLGRLQHARGYTNVKYWDDIADEQWYGGLFIACPNTLYRIASLTKPITSFAVKRMLVDGVEDHAGDPMTLDTPFPHALPSHASRLTPDEVIINIERYPETSSWTATRYLDEVTIDHLLKHSGGWCESAASCPNTDGDSEHSASMFVITNDAQLVADWNLVYTRQISIPIARWTRHLYAFSQAGFAMWNGPIKWSEPGIERKYSNFGYMLLGRILERGTGSTEWTGWYDAVRSLVLEPIGMNHTFAARPTEDEAYPGEAPYWVNDVVNRYKSKPSIISKEAFNDGLGAFVSAAYGGGRRIDHTDAAAGLVSTISDYCRFLTDQRLFDLYTSSIDPTGRLWNVLGRNDVMEMRRPVFSGEARTWFIDSSHSGTAAKVEDGRIVTYNMYGNYHTGSWAGTAASAYLFPPNTNRATENVGIATMANGDLPHDEDEMILSLSVLLAGTLSALFDDFEWPDDQDYFDAH